MAEPPENFLLLVPPWQNWPSFPTARSSHADSYIAVIHYYIDELLSERATVVARSVENAKAALRGERPPADDVAVAPGKVPVN
jgi:hypothetical protein